MKKTLPFLLAAGLGALALAAWQWFDPFYDGDDDLLGDDDCDCTTCTAVRELKAAGPAARSAIDTMYGPDSNRSDPRTVH